MSELTATQRFIETAVAFWEASAKLANVASSMSNDHGRRAAYIAMNKLDDKLKMLVEDWNGDLNEGELAIKECSRSIADGNSGCEIFTADADGHDRCKSCRDREDERAWTALNERLMEDGGVDDSKYRRDMKESGRGHLIR